MSELEPNNTARRTVCVPLTSVKLVVSPPSPITARQNLHAGVYNRQHRKEETNFSKNILGFTGNYQKMQSDFCKHCRSNNLEGVNDCLSWCLVSGVDVNTGLMVACNYDNPAIVSRLVQVPGLDINYQDENGWTAAHQACRAGRT